MSALSRSHERQFNGEDWQRVATELAQDAGVDFESDEYIELSTSPNPDCDCGFCATAPWIG